MDYHQKYLKYKTKYLELKAQDKMILKGGSGKLNLYLFKADWCPHCTQFQKTWDELQQEPSLNNINFIEYEATRNKNKMEEFGVNSFPTILLTNGDQRVEYAGPRNIPSIKDFINNYKNK
jgi:thiol-disulfide isomerase/thioredoxin